MYCSGPPADGTGYRGSVFKQCQQDLDQDEHHDDDLEELRPERLALVGQHLVDAFDDLQLTLDAALPLAEVEARRQQAVRAGEVLVADELQDVAGPLEQVARLDFQLADQADARVMAVAPEGEAGPD